MYKALNTRLKNMISATYTTQHFLSRWLHELKTEMNG